MEKINVGLIGTGWCGGIRANTCAGSPIVNEIHIAEIDDARLESPDIQVGDLLKVPLSLEDFGRNAIQAAKQVVVQRVRESERENVYENYHDRVGEIITGTVQQVNRGNIIVNLGRAEALLPWREQIRREQYRQGDTVRAMIIDVQRNAKGPQIILSRASESFLVKLFEQEVPEILEGIVAIKAVSREAGGRSKIAVASNEYRVDPVGACVGMKGSRVQAVIREMRGEKIDIVQYDDDPSNYVRNALNPAQINRVAIREYETREMEVIVAEDQLSLAIGKRGQNVRLAGKLVGWSLDIKSEAEKKAEVEAEMERMATASQELASLPGIDSAVSTLLLDAGFRTIEEVSLASHEDLTGIDGIDEGYPRFHQREDINDHPTHGIRPRAGEMM